MRKACCIASFCTIFILSHCFVLKAKPYEEKWRPKILSQKNTVYLPDFSYAGYHWGELPVPRPSITHSILDFGALPNDKQDDTEAFKKAISHFKDEAKTIVLHVPQGRYIIKDILYIQRGNFILRGDGSGKTVIHIPVPLDKMSIPQKLKDQKKFFEKYNKRTPYGKLFSIFSWSGGVFWIKPPDKSPKPDTLPSPVKGTRGGRQILLASTVGLKPGDDVTVCWYNREGKNGAFLKHVVGKDPVRIGARLYEKKSRILVRQHLSVKKIIGNTVYTKEPLIHDIKPTWCSLVKPISLLQEVGIEGIKIDFPKTTYEGHHAEAGYNALAIHGVKHSWVRDVIIHNADSGIIIGRSKNVSVLDTTFSGRGGHYSIMIGGSTGILTKKFKCLANDVHGPSVNTGCINSVFTQGVAKYGRLDQHCGLNAQNLFDKLEVDVGHRLFEHGGAGYWYPAAGLFNTFWNIKIKEVNGQIKCHDAPQARLIGLYSQGQGKKGKKLDLRYGPRPYIEGLGKGNLAVPSLYEYQLKQRLK